MDLEGPQQSSNIESTKPTDLRSSASETSDSTTSADTPTLVAFICWRVSSEGMQSIATAVSVGDIAMEESPDATVGGTASDLGESRAQGKAGRPMY